MRRALGERIAFCNNCVAIDFVHVLLSFICGVSQPPIATMTITNTHKQASDNCVSPSRSGFTPFHLWRPTPVHNGAQKGWTELARLQQEGKVRYIGVSNFSVSQMKRAQAIAPITSLQPPYSIVTREIEEDILPFCTANNIGVIVYSPMSAGLLTGSMTRERVANFTPEDWRRNLPISRSRCFYAICAWLNICGRSASAMAARRAKWPSRGRSLTRR